MSDRKTCLIVDDSDVVRRVVRMIVEGLDFDVEDCGSTDEAFAVCRKSLPDLIVVDWHIPGSQPLDFIQAVRSLPMGRYPKVIYMLTNNDPAEIDKGRAAGADLHMIKPFHRETLEARVAKLITPDRHDDHAADGYMEFPARAALAGR